MLKDKKEEIIKKYRISQKDCGSSEIQIAILSENIDHLTKHLKKNKKDIHSKKGLLSMVNKRKSFLQYLKKKNIKKYIFLTEELNIRK